MAPAPREQRHCTARYCGDGLQAVPRCRLLSVLGPSRPPADSEEDDPELLLHVPFDGAVKLTGITVIGGADGTSPSKLKVPLHSKPCSTVAAHLIQLAR